MRNLILKGRVVLKYTQYPHFLPKEQKKKKKNPFNLLATIDYELGKAY